MASKATARRLRRTWSQIAELLLNTGADVNAMADLYGGSTTLALVATSVHPERAGVQTALLQLLLDHGATIDTANSPAGPLINICLANGRAQAAEFLASRGANLDLEAAAGLGRLNIVKSYFDESGARRQDSNQWSDRTRLPEGVRIRPQQGSRIPVCSAASLRKPKPTRDRPRCTGP